MGVGLLEEVFGGIGWLTICKMIHRTWEDLVSIDPNVLRQQTNNTCDSIVRPLLIFFDALFAKA